MEIGEIVDRPLLAEMLRRSEADWGGAPKYNEAYRQLRWPGRPWAMQSMPHSDIDTPLSIVYRPDRRFEFREQMGPGARLPVKPAWLDKIIYEQGLKSRGTWNRGRRGQKLHTQDSLRQDLKVCMMENIPFKTNSLEYKPSNQWLYIKGVRVVKYNLVMGRLEGFTYSGVYDKVISLMLRKLFFIDIKLEKRKLIWVNPPSRLELETRVEIDLNRYYTFRWETPEVIRQGLTRYTPVASRYLLINTKLQEEYLISEGLLNTSDEPVGTLISTHGTPLSIPIPLII